MEDFYSPVQNLQLRWQAWIEQVDGCLAGILDSLSNDCPDRLRNALRYSLLSPGKRLRPVLALMMAEVVGGDGTVAMPAACALEMVHCYSLIHDDLPPMDDDDLRRGRPTCHIQFDEATAILAGDALQALAFETLLKAPAPAEIVARACCLLAQAAGPEGMVGGQSDDLQAEKEGGDPDLLASIHRRKSGALIQVACQLGAMLATANSNQLTAAAEYGQRVGLAFQIMDDLLDVESNSQALGKRTGKDQDRGKLTFPGIFGVEASRQRVSELADQAKLVSRQFGTSGELLEQLAGYLAERQR